MESVKQFQSEIASLYESKPPISKAKMGQITKAGMKGLKYYKHIVQTVEKFIGKCKPEYKVPGLYVIDSIVRQSRHQFGPDKDVFGPRFLKNMTTTFHFLMKCPDADKPKIARVLSLWQKSQLFGEDDLRPLFDIVDGDESKLTTEEIQLHTEFPSSSPANAEEPHNKDDTNAEKQVATSVEKADKGQEVTGKSGTKSGAIDPSLLQQIQKLTNQLLSHQQTPSAPEAKLSKKILSADYEYSDDDSDDQTTGRENLVPQNIAAAAKDLLQNTDLIQHIQQIANAHSHTLGKTPVKPVAPPVPVPMPSAINTSLPPPGYGGPNIPQFNASVPPPTSSQQKTPVRFEIKPQHNSYTAPVEPIVPEFIRAREALSTGKTDETNSVDSSQDKEDRKRSKHSKRRHSSRSRSRSRDRGKRRRSSSRSRSSRKHRRSRSDSGERRERDRRKVGLPSVRSKHVTICSRTLWLGRVPPYCEPKEIIEALKDYGEPVSVDIISPRGCAYVVMPDRKSAFKVLDRLKDIKLQGRQIKMAWAPGKGMKEGNFKDMWDVESGASYVPWHMLPADLSGLLDGGYLDRDSLPDELKASYPDPDVQKSSEIIQTLQAPIPVMPSLSAKLQPVAAVLPGMQFPMLHSRPPPTGGIMLGNAVPFPPPTGVLPPGAGGLPFGGVPVRFASGVPPVAYAAPATPTQLPGFNRPLDNNSQLQQFQQGIRAATLVRPLFPNPPQQQPIQIGRPIMGMQFATGQPLVQQQQQLQHQPPPQQDFRDGRREFGQASDNSGWRNDHTGGTSEGRNDDRRQNRFDSRGDFGGRDSDRGSSSQGRGGYGNRSSRFDDRPEDRREDSRGRGGHFERESRWRDDSHRDEHKGSRSDLSRLDEVSSRRSERDERRSSPERSERSRRDGDRPRRSRWGQTDEEVKRTDKSDTIGEDVSKMGGIGSKPEERESSGLIVPDIKSKEREISGGKETVNMFATESAVPAEPEGWD